MDPLIDCFRTGRRSRGLVCLRSVRSAQNQTTTTRSIQQPLLLLGIQLPVQSRRRQDHRPGRGYLGALLRVQGHAPSRSPLLRPSIRLLRTRSDLGQGLGRQSTYRPTARDYHRRHRRRLGRCHNLSIGRRQDQNPDSGQPDRVFDARAGIPTVPNDDEAVIFPVDPIRENGPSSHQTHLDLVSIHIGHQSRCSNPRHLLRRHGFETHLSHRGSLWLVSRYRTSLRLDQRSEYDHVGLVSTLTSSSRTLSFDPTTTTTITNPLFG